VKILLINGNTSDAITASMARVARAVASAGTEVIAVTAEFGARVVSSRSENAIASHAVVTAAAQHHEGCDAVLVAISMDTGRDALRELMPIPAVGMTEAAALVACTLGSRFGVVTLGKRTVPMYEELIAGYGLERRLAGIEAVDIATTGYDETQRIQSGITELAARLIERGAEVIVLAGAAIAGQHRELQADIAVPLLDGITCGVHLAELLVRVGAKKATVGSFSHPGPKALVNVDPSLTKLFGKA
jgi:allantoin racemase